MVVTTDRLQNLIAIYQRHRSHYRSGGYNETPLRVDFVDPLFIAMGWDVRNEAGYAEAYRDVVHEDAIKVGTATKAPDYAFRVGGVRKFFLETKKPSVDIASDPVPAFQLRRYAWSAKLPLSILTNFEYLAVYDTRVKPNQNDLASTARVMLIHYTEYLEKWDEIAGIFAPESIRMGSFDEYADSTRAKRGTATVDDAFLADLEHWREMLARNIALRNEGLTQRELNYAVQITIDRIIFLRICEDRGIEEYGRLQGLLNGRSLYARLQDLYRQADERYNSGLFHFRQESGRGGEPDELTTTLNIDDSVLKDIFRNLYYPNSPYEFSALPADILGQIYERFLGSVIRVGPSGKRAWVEEKPEVRKAGGVYYTPTYIVDYIVKQTVGKLLEGKTSRAASRLKILDPACGSGSFLIGAYQYLLDWHLEQYVADGPENHTKILYQGAAGEWRLTTAERRRILLNNIYGVDIDQQAVEVTKLSLLLKVLEGETGESLSRQLRFVYRERALPDLRDNIKCGNSLIGPDFYQNTQLSMAMFDEEERYRINVFDWAAEFPDIFKGKNPGFDAVIGNPPYIRIQHMREFAPNTLDYYKAHYRAASKGNYDIYVVFAERGLQLLNKHGLLGYILPHKFFNAKYGEPLRGLIAEGKHLHKIVHFGHQQVFVNATTYTCLLFLDNGGGDEFEFVKVNDQASWRLGHDEAVSGAISADLATNEAWIFPVGHGAELFQRLRKHSPELRVMTDRIAQGLRTSANDVYVLQISESANGAFRYYSESLGCVVDVEEELLSKFLSGRDIKRFKPLEPDQYVLIPYRLEGRKSALIGEHVLRDSYPLTYQYLQANKQRLESREHGRMRGPSWYGYVYPKNLDVMKKRKILVPDIADRAAFAIDNEGTCALTSGYGLTLSEDVDESYLYVLGCLNSRLLDFYIRLISTPLRGGFFRYFTQYIERLPVRRVDFDDTADVERHDRMVNLVQQMLDLHEQHAAARTDQDKQHLQRLIEATDHQIDHLVYELYGLTEEEIAIVEGEVG